MKNRFEHVAVANIKRNGIDELLKSLEQSDFYSAPASTRYHHSFEGGLVSHSLDVMEFLINDMAGITIEKESLYLVSLFHDICKVGYYKTDMRNTKDDSGRWIKVPYYTVEDKLPLGHGEKSVIMLMEHVELTLPEMMAVRWHMGLSVPKEDYGSMGRAFEEFPLALYLHIADMKSTYLGKDRNGA